MSVIPKYSSVNSSPYCIVSSSKLGCLSDGIFESNVGAIRRNKNSACKPHVILCFRVCFLDFRERYQNLIFTYFSEDFFVNQCPSVIRITASRENKIILSILSRQ